MASHFPDTSNTPEVVIVGGGVAGCATAIALKRFVPELDVALVDRGHASACSAAEDADIYSHHIQPRIGETLPPQVIIPMQQLGIWERFTHASLQASPNSSFVASTGTQAAWGTDQPHINEYIYSPYGNGWHLDRRQFDALMLTIAREQGVQLINNSQVIDVERIADRWRLQLRSTAPADGVSKLDTLTAQFVVDATGRSARIAQHIGSNKQVFDHLVGIYRFYAPADNSQLNDTPSDSSTIIESVANGWWYSARLPGQTQVTALMTDADLARSKNYRQSIQYDQALAATILIAQRVAGLSVTGAPITTAAHTQCLDRIAGIGWLATGDAAFTYDPLSSLGIFKALRMSIFASYAIKDYFNSKDLELNKYNRVAAAEFLLYLAKRREYYAEETRFINNTFWSRRLAA